MSFVTTAIWKRSRMFLQSKSTRAVFPEPTGPPTPTRSVSCSCKLGFVSWLMFSRSFSGLEEATILSLVKRARDREPWKARAHVAVGEALRKRHGVWNGKGDGGKDPLCGELPERNESRQCTHLALCPRKGETKQGFGQRD